MIHGWKLLEGFLLMTGAILAAVLFKALVSVSICG